MIRRVAPLLGLLLAACGTGSSDEPTAAPTTTLAAASTDTTTREGSTGGSAVLPAEVPEALLFSAPLIGGGDIELTTLAGRPVLLWFWAPW